MKVIIEVAKVYAVSRSERSTTGTAYRGAWFATTHWSVVLRAGQRDPALATEALENLCRSYWYPLYAFVRRKGYAVPEAEDLTQGFFARLLSNNFRAGIRPVARRMFVAGNHAYVADVAAGLQVIDISNPADPQPIGGFDTPGEARSVVVSGTHAYLADGNSGLQIIDVSNPRTPQWVGGCDTAFYAWDVEVADGYAFVADLAGGLHVIDVSDPSSPQRVGGYPGDLFHSAFKVTLSGNCAHLLIHGFVNGVLVLDITAPADPTRISSYGSFDVHSFTLSRDYAYMVDVVNRLEVSVSCFTELRACPARFNARATSRPGRIGCRSRWAQIRLRLPTPPPVRTRFNSTEPCHPATRTRKS